MDRHAGITPPETETEAEAEAASETGPGVDTGGSDRGTGWAWALIQLARLGRPEAVLAELSVGPAPTAATAMVTHYVRGVAWHEAGDHRAAITEADLALTAAEATGHPGWRALSLTLRATERLLLPGEQVAGPDEAAVADLARAESLLHDMPATSRLRAPVQTGLAVGYHLMGLYELVLPHLQAPVRSGTIGDSTPADAWLQRVNLALLDLDWAADLDRCGFAGVTEHRATAAGHARMAAAVADGSVVAFDPDAHPSTVAMVGAGHRARARLLLACARAELDDPVELVQTMTALIRRMDGDRFPGSVRQSLAYLARALQRSGQPEQAVATADRAVRAAGSDWAAQAHARATLMRVLAEQGAAGAQEGLAYGRMLSGQLWRRRVRRLKEAQNLLAFESLRHEHARVSRLPAEDPLTGLANRRRFEELLTELSEGAPAGHVAVLIVDVDGFRTVNDNVGHPAGDVVLQHVGHALRSVTRSADLLARIGGDEFAVVLPGLDVVQAADVGRRALAAVRDPAGDPDPVAAFTVSIGIAVAPAFRVRQAVVAADDALRRVKRAGEDGIGLSGPVGVPARTSDDADLPVA